MNTPPEDTLGAPQDTEDASSSPASPNAPSTDRGSASAPTASAPAPAAGPPGPAATLADLPLRPELVGEQPYGAPQLDVPVRLNVNENPYPPGAFVIADMVRSVTGAARQLNRYPDRDARALRNDLARYLGFGLSADNIWVGNGSNEVMTHLLSAFAGPGRTLLTFSPTYSMYPEYARNTHTAFVTAARTADYRVEADLVAAAIDRYDPDVILITTPNNPTGTITPISVIEQICERTRAMVIVDEAYQEFTANPDDSAIALLPSFPRLVVTRTMSKAFALAGGRLGYLAANPAVVQACQIVRLPYHLSAHSQILARVALRHSESMLQRVDDLSEECQDLQEWLRGRGLEVIPSEANFCLFGRFADRHAVWQALLDHGVLIRETGPAGFLRVSAGTPAEMAAFRRALDEVLPDAARADT